jgi:hypothetical protein
MNLSERELDWINKRMDWYGIKYQEIYNEIFDHIVSAIELERAEGNKRTIDIVFDKVTDRDFGGYLGVDKIVKTYERAYRSKIRKAMLVNFKYYFNWETMLLAAVLTITGFYLPHTKTTSIVIFVALLLAACVPVMYAYRNSPEIKTDDGKQSIIKVYMVTRSLFLMYVLNQILFLFGIVAKEWDVTFLSPKNFHPVVYMALFSFYIIYGLSIIKLCKQEFKIAG